MRGSSLMAELPEKAKPYTGWIRRSGTSRTAATSTRAPSSGGGRCSRSRRAIGVLRDFELRFDLPVGPGERGVANVAPRPGDHVWGALYQLTHADAERLDRTEGVPQGVYRRLEVEVHTPDGARVAAFTYRSEISRPERKPSRRYLGLLLAGARELGLPAECVERLRAWPLAVDERELSCRSCSRARGRLPCRADASLPDPRAQGARPALAARHRLAVPRDARRLRGALPPLPALLTTPELRAVYPMALVRALIAGGIVAAAALGALAVALHRGRRLGALGLALALAAQLAGGAWVEVETPVRRSSHLGLDWLALDLLLLVVGVRAARARLRAAARAARVPARLAHRPRLLLREPPARAAARARDRGAGPAAVPLGRAGPRSSRPSPRSRSRSSSSRRCSSPTSRATPRTAPSTRCRGSGASTPSTTRARRSTGWRARASTWWTWW